MHARRTNNEPVDVGSPYEKALEVGGAAAREAGAYILGKAGSIDRKTIREKDFNELVTDVDVEAQRIITERILDTWPKNTIFAEEDADERVDVTTLPGYVWIVDPLDGTTNFTRGVPPYAVSIALQHNGELVLGIVLDVSRNELFTAVKGMGTFINGKPCSISDTPHLNDSLLTTGFPYRVFDHVDGYMSALQHFMRETRGVRRPGSASVDLAYVACGRFDGFFEVGLRPWDVAAGIVLVREAGGMVTDFENETSRIMEGQILASNGRIHDHMVHVLQPLRNEVAQ